MIVIQNLQVRFGRNPPVLCIDRLQIDRGEFVVVIGPSGAGKSTLLRCMSGYVRPSRGNVLVDGVDLWAGPRRDQSRVKRRIGLIYQQFHLARRLTVLQNVLCGRLGVTSRWRSLFGYFSPQDRAIAWSALCEVGLGDQVH